MNKEKLARRMRAAIIVNNVERNSRPNYIVEMMGVDEMGNPVNYKNPKIDREICEFYANKPKKEFNNEVKGRSCKHCNSEGVLLFNRPNGEFWLQACYCVQKNLEKHNIDLDNLDEL
jgi:hypothetical protein